VRHQMRHGRPAAAAIIGVVEIQVQRGWLHYVEAFGGFGSVAWRSRLCFSRSKVRRTRPGARTLPSKRPKQPDLLRLGLRGRPSGEDRGDSLRDALELHPPVPRPRPSRRRGTYLNVSILHVCRPDERPSILPDSPRSPRSSAPPERRPDGGRGGKTSPSRSPGFERRRSGGPTT
jgi:hypothetical protein